MNGNILIYTLDSQYEDRPAIKCFQQKRLAADGALEGHLMLSQCLTKNQNDATKTPNPINSVIGLLAWPINTFTPHALFPTAGGALSIGIRITARRKLISLTKDAAQALFRTFMGGKIVFHAREQRNEVIVTMVTRSKQQLSR